MANLAPSTSQALAAFDDHAVAIARRQYFQPGDDDLLGLFRRVADWVATPEDVAVRSAYAETFFDLMLSKRFCPGGRVLAGAATNHGNVLNCFVQDGAPEPEASDAWVLNLATKLAKVTKVGGGNGLCLDPIAPKRQFTGAVGRLYLTIEPGHQDYEKVRTGTFLDLVHGTYVTRGYGAATFVEYDDAPVGVAVRQVGDSVESIWRHASGIVTTLLSGHDLLLDLSELRAEGTPVNGSGGTSSGPSSFAVEVFDNFARWAQLGGAAHAGPVATLRYVFSPTLRVIRQGGTRRGAGMATMSITHPDVEDFITAKDLDRELAEGDISTFNISVLVGDEFMRSAEASRGDGILQRIAEHAWSTGEPGLIYIDRINEHNPMRASLGEIKATNPCFPADVRIATHRGLVTLGELHETGEPLLVASDRRVSGRGPGITLRPAVPVFMTSRSAPVYRVVTEHGYVVRATADHRFLTPDGWTELRDLRPGATLLLQSAEGVWSDRYEVPEPVATARRELVAAGERGDGGAAGERGDGGAAGGIRQASASAGATWSHELGAILGFATADGVAGAGMEGIGPGRAAVEQVERPGSTETRATEQRVPEPIFTAPRMAVVGFLQALFTADGRQDPGDGSGSRSIRLASSSPRLLQDVQLLLSNFGIVARIHAARQAAGPSTAHGRAEVGADDGAPRHELRLDARNGDAFAEKIGFLTAVEQRVEQVPEADRCASNGERYETTVVEVAFDGVEPVFDTTEPVAHSVIANGIVAHQCGEIPLFPGEPCDLGAVNLAQYVIQGDVGLAGFDTDAFKRDVKTCIRFLDNVLEVNHFALDDNREMSHYLRRLGLGIMGLADALILMGFRYDGEEGRIAASSIITDLREAAVEASRELAEERGPFPGIGESSLTDLRRNIALLTVAPTGTTSMLMGVSSGVEPIFAPFIYRKIGSSYAAIIAPLFKELLERHEPHPDFEKDGGWDWDEVVERVQERHGSVQGLDFVPDQVKAVLVCAHDIAPDDHVLMQGVVQSAFDAGGDMVANSISKTINLPNEATVGDVHRAYSLAFESGCKGITVYRDGSRQFQVLSTSAERRSEPAAGAAVATAPVAPTASPNGATAQADGGTAPDAGPAAGGASPRRAVPVAAPLFERLPSEPLFDRPIRLEGFTDAAKLTLPGGEKRGFYVTVNKQDGLPVECFVTSGKAGDEANADSEALGRVVSVALQYGVPAEAIVKTLRGINGGMYGTYQGRMVASRADLIAVALETAGAENLLQRGKGCPDCGAPLRFEEGCMKCESCGFSKCG